MPSNAGKTVAEILQTKKASIQKAPLPRGSPSWTDILKEPWEVITKRAQQRIPGYQTIRKLLNDPEYNK